MTFAPSPVATVPRHPLQRSRTDRKLAGVCGGLGSYLGVDPTVVRLALVFLTVFGPATIVAYLAAMVLVPEEPVPAPPAAPPMPATPAAPPMSATPAAPPMPAPPAAPAGPTGYGA